MLTIIVEFRMIDGIERPLGGQPVEEDDGWRCRFGHGDNDCISYRRNECNERPNPTSGFQHDPKCCPLVAMSMGDE